MGTHELNYLDNLILEMREKEAEANYPMATMITIQRIRINGNMLPS